jgi:dTDP-4-amino-4,6-dideoxygalactose transaminase
MTTGEGGMVVTDREEVARRAARFVNHGRADSNTHVEVGHNFRMTSLAAAIGRVQLERLPEFVERRRTHAAKLTETLERTSLVAPVEPDDRTHVYHQYTIRCGDRERARESLDEFGVDTGVYYPTPIHEQPAYDDLDHDAPVSEVVSDQVFSVPVHPELSIRDVDIIATGLVYTDRYALSE